ncbi:MAG: NUDIX hydrolase [Chloroflexi bacterium]|nr:NUDIX hydrolase [Chloroflexota bacterium]
MFTVERSEKVFQGRVFDVRRDWVRLPNGRTTALDIITHHGAVTLVPLDEQGRLWFVQQYRHAAGTTLLEFPAGTLEPNEAPEACAAREIREEIGMAAENLQLLGTFYLAPGYSTEYMHVYLATGLSPAPLPPDADEILEPVALPIDEVLNLAHAGQLQDAKTLAALMLALPYLKPEKSA